MCGIAGIFHYSDPDCPVDRVLLARMTRRIAHRGPDGEGFYVDGPLGLGHRRLSIIDLTATGAQPMKTANGSHVITYNGEFYNHARYRSRLADAGVQFRGTSDTETLLHLMRLEGPEALRDTAGIFAFALWDRAQHRLLLARDHLGVKQLYVYDDGRTLYFASEIKALLECPKTPRRIDTTALNQYIHFHTPIFSRTMFDGIAQLQAGEFAWIDSTGMRRKRYWEVTDFEERGGTDEANVEALRVELRRIVGEQLLSDVPVGAFFSGGIDSTAIAAYAAASGRAPRCFGIHFTGAGVIDERPYQEEAARSLGLDVDLMTIDGGAFPDDLVRLLWYQDQPVIGAALFPMYYVAQLASRHVKVCIGGQAADEVFGGYARYALVHPMRVLASSLRRRFHSSTSGAAPSPQGGRVGGNLWKQLVDPRNIRRLIGVSGVDGWRKRYFNNFASVPESSWHSLLADESILSRESAWREYSDTLDESNAEDPADKVMHWDMQTYLTGLFQQDDRMSMANSLESRVPFADPRMVRFAFKSGFRLKFRDGASKWLLRQAVADSIPFSVLNRRKVGFDTPAEAWIKGPHRGFVRDLLLSKASRERGLFRVDRLERLLANDRHPDWFALVWKAISIEAWARVFLDGEEPPGVGLVSAGERPPSFAAHETTVL